MKRQLITRNKRRLSARFKQIADIHQRPTAVVITSVSFASISESKIRGQQSHQRRLRRQNRMNPRQLKKYRQKQALYGLGGSQHEGMCRTKLKPAGFTLRPLMLNKTN